MRNSSVYLKMRVLGAIDMAEGKSIAERIRNVSRMTFTDEEGIQRQFTWRTISTWLYRYKAGGVTTMENKSRSDKGRIRKISMEELQEAVDKTRPKFRGAAPNIAAVYRMCIEEGLFTRSQVAPNTFRRHIKKYEMLKTENETQNKHRLAFAKAHANEMWQADTMFGPFIRLDGKPVQTKLIAFIDDCSRLCCHGQFFFSENTDTLVSALKAAFYKRGIPQSLYVDNGSIYTSKEIIQICARVGCILHHAPVRDGAAKGKVERFFRTVRGQFLSRNLDLSGIDILNRSFTEWAEEHYNAATHSVLGMPPLMQTISMSVNEEIRSRVTYSAILSSLAPEVVEEFILNQFDLAGLAHNTFTQDALALVVRSSEGILRRARNICIGSLIETVRDQSKTVGLPQVNRVLMQPHWRKDYDAPPN